MVPSTLSWVEGYSDASHSSDVDTVHDLDRLLDRLTAVAVELELPFNVTLARDAEAWVDIIVGAHVAAVQWIRREPWSCLVGVDPSRSEEGDPITFAGNGQHSELDRKWCVQPALARDAIRHYLTTGQLTPALRWEPF